MADIQKNQLVNSTVKPRNRIVTVTRPLSSMPNLIIATFPIGSFQAYQYANVKAVTTAPKSRINVGSSGNGTPSSSKSAGGPTRAGAPHTRSVTIHFRNKMPRKKRVRLLLVFTINNPPFPFSPFLFFHFWRVIYLFTDVPELPVVFFCQPKSQIKV